MWPMRRCLTVAIMLGVLGCSAAPPPSAAPVPPEPGPSSWSSWRPSRPVRDLAQLSEADKRAVRDADLAQRASRYPVTDPPAVELERWIMPHEIGPTAEACMADAGFVVKSNEDGQGLASHRLFPRASAMPIIEPSTCAPRGSSPIPRIFSR